MYKESGCAADPVVETSQAGEFGDDSKEPLNAVQEQRQQEKEAEEEEVHISAVHWRCYHCWTSLDQYSAKCIYCKDKTIPQKYEPT